MYSFGSIHKMEAMVSGTESLCFLSPSTSPVGLQFHTAPLISPLGDWDPVSGSLGLCPDTTAPLWS